MKEKAANPGTRSSCSDGGLRKTGAAAEQVQPHVQELSFNGGIPEPCALQQQTSLGSRLQRNSGNYAAPSNSIAPTEQVLQELNLDPAGEHVSQTCVLSFSGYISSHKSDPAAQNAEGTHGTVVSSTSPVIKQIPKLPQLSITCQQQRQYSPRQLQVHTKELQLSPLPEQQTLQLHSIHHRAAHKPEQRNHIHQQQEHTQLPPLVCQSCSVPTDLEVMDQMLDELVLLDPNISKVLARAPPVQFETFQAESTTQQAASSSGSTDADDAGDIHQTFLTACAVPEDVQCRPVVAGTTSASPRTSSLSKCSAGPEASLGVQPNPAALAQRPSLLPQPEVACSADLFNWNLHAASETGQNKSMARLHNKNITADIDCCSRSCSGSGGANSCSGKAKSTYYSTSGQSRMSYSLHGGSICTLDPALAAQLIKQQQRAEELAAVANLQQWQVAAAQETPSLHALQHQMDDIRKLHLSGVKAEASGLNWLQQQKAVAITPCTPCTPAGGHISSSASTRRVSALTPPTQRQRQLYADYPVLQPKLGGSQASTASYISMRASAPAWKRGK